MSASRREKIVSLTALAFLGAALIALGLDVYPRVAMVVLVVTCTVNAVTLTRSLLRLTPAGRRLGCLRRFAPGGRPVLQPDN